MQRSDRAWTAVIAETGLDRAQPLLRVLNPALFDTLDLATALRACGDLLSPDTNFQEIVSPRLQTALAARAAPVMNWLGTLPFGGADERPAADFWRMMWTDLVGGDAPIFADRMMEQRWAQFVAAWRGRLADPSTTWLRTIADDARFVADFGKRVAAQRNLSFTPHDRSLYARFGWNDSGDMRGLAGLVEGVELERVRRAWQAAAPYFEAEEQRAIEAAAHRLTIAEDKSAWAGAQPTLATTAANYGVTPDQIEADLYASPASPPALAAILRE